MCSAAAGETQGDPATARSQTRSSRARGFDAVLQINRVQVLLQTAHKPRELMTRCRILQT